MRAVCGNALSCISCSLFLDMYRHLWHTQEEIEAAKEAARRKAAVRMVGSLKEHPALPPVDVDAVLAANVYDSAPSTPIPSMQPEPRPLRRQWSRGSLWLQGKRGSVLVV